MKEQSKQPSALRRFFMRCAAKKELIYLIIGAVTVLASTVLLICRIAAGSANFLQIVTMALMIVGGLCSMYPGLISDVVGIVLVAGIAVLQKTSAKKEAAAA